MLTEKSKSFVHRRYEESQLENEWNREQASLVILYGRRRIGKTRLLNEFCLKKKSFRFEGLEKGNTQEQISHFLEQLSSQTRNKLLAKVQCASWKEAFDLLTQAIKGKSLVIVFDELPWMIEKDPKNVGIIKYFWDNFWSRDAKKMFILCGSINTFMVEHLVFSEALYGRINLELHLKPFSIQETFQFFNGKKNQREILDLYMTFGGIPKYLEEINAESSVQNINRLCFLKNSFFTREFERLFHDEFDQPQIYSNIVNALAQKGNLSYSEILNDIKATMGGGYEPYLKNLERADFIESFQPFHKSEDSRLMRYRLVDEYLLFYFSFIKPSLRKIAQNTDKNIFLNFFGKQTWNIWSGFAFERFCQKHVHLIQKILHIDQLVKNYGSLFSRKTSACNGFQIDLLFERHDKVITVCEIKYLSKPVGTEIIPQMEKKLALLKTGKNISIEKVLITVSPANKALMEQHYFNRIISINDFFQTQ